MMTGGQILDIVMLRLVRSDSALRAGLLLELNMLIHGRLEAGQLLPWFLYLEDTSASTVANTETVAFPTGFIRFDDGMEKGGLFYNDTSITLPDPWVPLTRGQGNDIKALYADNTYAAPEMYDLQVGQFLLRPIPDAIYPLKVAGMFASANVTDDGNTTLWTIHAADLLVAELTLVGATLYTRDADLVEIAMAERNVCMTRLRTAHTAFMESMQERSMGDD